MNKTKDIKKKIRSKYRVESTDIKPHKIDKRLNTQTISVAKTKKNDFFNIDETMIFVKQMMAKKKEKSENPDNVKIMIRGRTHQGVRTLKGYSENLEDIENGIDDYLNGRVSDPTAFKQFSSISISVIY